MRPELHKFALDGHQQLVERDVVIVPSVDVACEADGRKLRATVLHPWHGTG
jgi:hypothetical protein